MGAPVVVGAGVVIGGPVVVGPTVVLGAGVVGGAPVVVGSCEPRPTATATAGSSRVTTAGATNPAAAIRAMNARRSSVSSSAGPASPVTLLPCSLGVSRVSS